MSSNGTYRSDSAGGRDCAHGPGGLAESVPEHLEQEICVWRGIESQLPGAIEL